MQKQSELLSEIFPIPSAIIIEDRFSLEKIAESAGCSGKCSSPGGCRLVESHDA